MRKCTKCLAGTLALLALLMLIGIIPTSAKPMGPFIPKKIEAIEDTAPKMILIEDGTSKYVIVRGAQASPSEVTAAEKLQRYLERISGCVLPIVTDDEAARDYEIIIGRTTREGIDTYEVPRGELGDEGFILKTVGESIVIAGGEKRGTLYGTFDFLEKFLGCLWLTGEVTVVPEAQTVAVPAEIDVLEKPAFAFRNPIVVPYLCADVDYCLANRINAGAGVVVNLRRAQLTHRVWKADTMKGEFSGLFSSGRIANNRQLLEDIWELDVTILGFDHKFVTVEESERLKIYRLMPRYWSWRQLGYGTKEKAQTFPQLLWGWIFD